MATVSGEPSETTTGPGTVWTTPHDPFRGSAHPKRFYNNTKKLFAFSTVIVSCAYGWSFPETTRRGVNLTANDTRACVLL